MNKQELAGIIAISSALTACGGGGSGNEGNTDNSGGTGSGGGNNNDYSKPSSKEEAARFLLQSQLNTSVSEINALLSSNYKDYLTNQFNLPVSQSAVDWLNSKGYNVVDNYAYFDNTYPGDCVIWQQLFKSNDNLRKRIALALSEFFVVSLSGLNMAWRSHAIASWWDMINQHCFSTYRELLYYVSTHPAMGNYLNIAGSKKENSAGRQPDENYAREVMQLFSVGLYQLNNDGTEKTDNGKYVDTYSQSDITNLAKIFTGWNYDYSQNVTTPIVINGNNRNVPNTFYAISPLTFNSADHSSGAATFLGSTVAGGTDGYARLNSALDIISNHPNVAPFFCKQMIKKLVTSNPSRRKFLSKSSQVALMASATPFISTLSMINEAAAQSASDYKALVCVFLFGGNDYANTVIPYDDTYYNQYHTIRSGGTSGQVSAGIAIAKSDLNNTLLNPTMALANNRQYALHPSLSHMSQLFNSGLAAVQLNVGPLIVPLTRTQYNSSDRINFPIPPKLFSHNDQQSIWQSSSPEGSTIGWGGNIADLIINQNNNQTFTCISVAGNTVFLAGDSTIAYNISTGGAIPINGVKNSVYGSSAVQNVLSTLIQQPHSNILANEYNKITSRSISCESQITSALSGVSLTTSFDTTNSLANQLQMVAKLIAARNSLGNKRQVFFVSLGGFDLHDNLITQHAKLLTQVDNAMNSFYQATVELGVSQQVTAFTASDFGRTLASNGDGSDHGWGSHHFVVGGAVNGQKFYGTPPSVDIGNTAQDHVGQGRLIPSTSVDQYAATLAKWYGVSDNDLYNILPNLHNFGSRANRLDYPTDMGFMKT